MSLKIWGDGACSGNPGPGGWAILIWDQNNKQIHESMGGLEHTTNNQMELECLCQALEWCVAQGFQSRALDLYWDSKYVIKGFESYLKAWSKNGFVKSDGQPVLNQSYWKRLLELQKNWKSKLNMHYVPGHAGIFANERVNELAQSCAQSFRQGGAQNGQLLSNVQTPYSGKFDSYIFKNELQDQVEETPEPNESSKELKLATKKNSSKIGVGYPVYLSLLEGVCLTHGTWSECEARVKGKSGAKFKKVRNFQEERDFKEKWKVPLKPR